MRICIYVWAVETFDAEDILNKGVDHRRSLLHRQPRRSHHLLQHVTWCQRVRMRWYVYTRAEYVHRHAQTRMYTAYTCTGSWHDASAPSSAL